MGSAESLGEVIGGRNQGVSRDVFLTRGSGEGSAPRGRFQLGAFGKRGSLESKEQHSDP